MDPVIQNIILGVVANGFTGMIAYLGQAGRDCIIGKEMLEKIDRDKSALEPILHKGTDSLAENIEWGGPAKLEEVCLFLSSPEVESIVRQIYSTKLSQDQTTMDLIKKEFLSSFSLFVCIEEGNVADQVFNALIDSCESALDIAINNGIISAHEAKSAFRYRRILDEISTIEKKIDILSGK
jgi:hypothetical protein